MLKWQQDSIQIFHEVMNKAEDLWNQIKPVFDKYDLSSAKAELEQLDAVGGEGPEDVRSDQWRYYWWLPSLVRTIRPAQIVELGGAWGVGALMILSELSKESKLYSTTLPEEPAFKYIRKDYPNLIKLIGDHLDLDIWPKDIDLKKTDIWFIDSNHTASQLRKELELYTPFFKPRAILLFDDIHIDPAFYAVWLELPFDKYDASVLHIPSGFGIAVI